MFRRLILLSCLALPCCYAAPDLAEEHPAPAGDAGTDPDSGQDEPVDAGSEDSGVPCERECQNACRHDLADAGPRDPALLQCELSCRATCGT